MEQFEIKKILKMIREMVHIKQVGSIQFDDIKINWNHWIDDFGEETLEIIIYQRDRMILKRCSLIDDTIKQIEDLYSDQ